MTYNPDADFIQRQIAQMTSEQAKTFIHLGSLYEMVLKVFEEQNIPEGEEKENLKTEATKITNEIEFLREDMLNSVPLLPNAEKDLNEKIKKFFESLPKK